MLSRASAENGEAFGCVVWSLYPNPRVKVSLLASPLLIDLLEISLSGLARFRTPTAWSSMGFGMFELCKETAVRPVGMWYSTLEVELRSRANESILLFADGTGAPPVDLRSLFGFDITDSFAFCNSVRGLPYILAV